jgi:guanine deaminase
VDILVSDGRIEAMEPHGTIRDANAAVIRVDGRLIAPGLINGHHHSHESFHKGRYDNLPLELWMNFVRPSRPLPLTPRDVYLRTMIGAVEALRSGTTTIVDDLNVFPAVDPSHVEAALQAYEDAGIRAYVGLSLMDRPFWATVPFVEEEFGPGLLHELRERPVADVRPAVDLLRALARSHHPASKRVGVLVAPSAPQRCSDDLLRESRRVADELDLPMIIHVQETRLQVVTGHLMFGQTMVAHLDSLGILGPRTSLIHAVWLTPEEIVRIADAGASVQHNPFSNLKLGSGLAPVRALLKAGVNVSLGSDGCGSIDTVNLHPSLASAALMDKLRDDDFGEWLGADEAWRMATQGGAAALGRTRDLGRIAVGCAADLVAYRLNGAALTPLNDPVRQLVFAEFGQSVDLVMIAGQVVLSEGHLRKVDENALFSEIQEVHARVAPYLEESERDVSRMKPALERIYRRCLEHPIASNTFAAKLHCSHSRKSSQ